MNSLEIQLKAKLHDMLSEINKNRELESKLSDN